MWTDDAIFYHVYPLGLCAAPARNDRVSPPVERLNQLYAWADHSQWLGVTAWYLGPVFESESHGYDTLDYFQVDRRLGSDETLARLVADLHQRGMRVILDAVFNHVGRGHWIFQDIQKNGRQSPYCAWVADLNFDQRSPYDDPFSYAVWNGHYNLVKLNLREPAVREHLFSAVKSWVERFDIDGLRLDAADCLDHQFLAELNSYSHKLKPDFWLMGEVVHGDYRNWANPSELQAVTNYEAYKGIYSSLNSHNLFEIAYTLNRQFGAGGLYRDCRLYNFVDNHDVNRLASQISNPAHLQLAYTLLFTMPGVPSIYYGSDFGVTGAKNGGDEPLRPALDINALRQSCPQPDLLQLIHRLAHIYHQRSALRRGDYREMMLQSDLLIFLRQDAQDWVLIAINSGNSAIKAEISLPGAAGIALSDLLNSAGSFSCDYDRLQMEIAPFSAMVIAPRAA